MIQMLSLTCNMPTIIVLCMLTTIATVHDYIVCVTHFGLKWHVMSKIEKPFVSKMNL